MTMKHVRAVMAGAAALCMASGMAFAADPYYADKTITFIVPAPAGGASDLTCRIMAQYLPAHIPGNPTIIVKSMSGGASMIATNYVGLQAKKDGLTLLCGVSAPNNQLTHEPGLKFDIKTFDYILGEGTGQAVYARADMTPPVHSVADFAKAEDVVLGGFASNGIRDIGLRLMVELLGVKKYRYVVGLEGDSAGRAAIEQKFINTYVESGSSYDAITYPSMVKTGEVTALFQSGDPGPDGHLTQRDPGLPDMPSFRDVYAQVYGKPPAGIDADLVDVLMGMWTTGSQILVLPPGVPAEASQAMHAAAAQINSDPGFLADAAKLRGPGARETTGDQVARQIKSYLDMSPDLLARYNELVKSGADIAQKHEK